MPTSQEILDDAIASRDALHRLENALNHQIDAINDVAMKQKRDVTAAERAQRDQFRAAIGEIEDAFAELGTVTLFKLDNADDVKTMLRDITDINDRLDDDLAQLKKIEAIAKQVADVTAQLAKVAGGLAKLVV